MRTQGSCLKKDNAKAMKKAHDKSNESKPDVDKAKKVYRAAIDGVRRLDEVLKKRKAYREVFLQDAVGLRNKLKEYCERLMFYNPMEYGRKAEEVLWRKVFYQTIQLIKQNRKHVRQGSSLEAAFRTHLSAATGYYNHLLFRLQYEFSLNLHGILDFHLVPEQKSGSKRGLGHGSRRKDVSPTVQDWAVTACHRCLMCLGDIARYQQDFDKGFSKAASERFYQQAIALSPDNGMPHNQLGTLSGSRYYHCEAAYHYLRCMVCEKPFEGSESNLQRLFEKNRKRLQEIKQNGNQYLQSEPQSFHDLKVFMIQFMHLLEIFLDTSKSVDQADLQENCQTTLQSFNLCMFHSPDNHCVEDPRLDSLLYLDDDMVFKLVVMCMATIHMLQLRGSRQVTAATAFLLALFSHILNHTVMRLQAMLEEKESPNKLIQADLHVEDDDDVSYLSDGQDNRSRHFEGQDELIGHYPHNDMHNDIDTHSDMKETCNTTIQDKQDKQDRPKSGRVKTLKRRRRRRQSDSSDSSDLSDVSDLSEGGEDLSDNYLSDETDEEEEFVGFFANDSDSDLSDNFMETELEPGYSKSHEKYSAEKYCPSENNGLMYDGNEFDDNNSAEWVNPVANENLAHLSSELISSSACFLRQNFRQSHANCKADEDETKSFENCTDVIQGKRDVSVPPGFAFSKEAEHVAEITNKLANFVIETDTEASLIPTDESEQSGADIDCDDDKSSASGDRSEIEHRHFQNALDAVSNEGLLSVVKVMGDWMRCNSSVIMTCAQSSQSLWHRLSVLCNILPPEYWLADHDQCWMEELKSYLPTVSKPDWTQVFPLREDLSLWQFIPLADVHSSLKLNIKRRGHLSEMQECFLRIGCIRQFGHFLSGLDSLNFTFDTTQKLFIGPSQPVDSTENEKEAMQRIADEESRRNQLMKDMAQLRLQVEVNQLEGSLLTTEQDSFPPYLIPDSSCLCDSLNMVKQLTQTGKGIVIIPTAVIDTLDHLKKESGRAREAIRWLETEFRKGNRYIRAQKNKEKLQDNVPRNLKKRNRQLWCLWEVLNCARYLAQQGGDISDGNIVAVLMAKELETSNFSSSIDKNMFTQEGISIESIGSFNAKWKDQVKNKG